VSPRSSRSARSASAGVEQGENLAVVRPASLFLLREDDLAVGYDVVLALHPRDGGGVETVTPQLGRETRGPFVVPASNRAVEDLDGHGGSVAARCDTRAMNDDDLRALESAGSQQTFEAGQVLTERGTPGTGLYLVIEGQIVVETPDDGLLELGPGAVVGERALFSEDGLRQARVRALTDGVVVAVGRAEVERLCAEDPEFAARLTRAS
jgi:hypothetical protein